jgi:hypothetical protein
MAQAPPTPATTPHLAAVDAVIQERDARLHRLRRSFGGISQGITSLLLSSRLPDTEVTSDVAMAVDGAKLAASTESLVSAVESVLALIREVKRDVISHVVSPPPAFVLLHPAEGLPTTGGIDANQMADT